mgnify:CR=1 FL=1
MLLKIKGAVKVSKVYLMKLLWNTSQAEWDTSEHPWDKQNPV